MLIFKAHFIYHGYGIPFYFMTKLLNTKSGVLESMNISPNYFKHARLEIFRAIKIQVHPEDGGSNVLRNAGILPHLYTTSQKPEDRDLYLKNVFITSDENIGRWVRFLTVNKAAFTKPGPACTKLPSIRSC
jgi:hypothetical protein